MTKNQILMLWICCIGIILITINLVKADCPYSGYTPGMKGVVISKWVEITHSMCWGICPNKLVEIANAWQPINRTAKWVYRNETWVEQKMVCRYIARGNSKVRDCSLQWIR